MDIRRKWLMNEKTTTKQREVLFLMMDALEIPMYFSTRNHEDVETYPFLRLVGEHQGGYIVDFSKAGLEGSGYYPKPDEQVVTYNDLFTALKDELSLKSKEVWI